MRLQTLLITALTFFLLASVGHFVFPENFLFQFWFIFPIAFAICVVVCTFGVEGAILFVPFFALAFPQLAFKLEPIQAVSIGLITEVFGFASSLIAFWRMGLVDFVIAKKSGYLSIPFALLGGFISPMVPGYVLLLIASVALLFMASELKRSRYLVVDEVSPVREVLPRDESLFVRVKPGSRRTLIDRCKCTYTYHYAPDTRRNTVITVGGIFEGLIGFGIGIFGVSDLVYRGIPIRVAVGTSHLVIMLTALAALAPHLLDLVFLGTRSIPWNVVAMTIPAVLIGGQTAAFVTGKVDPMKLKRILILLLVVLSAVTVTRAVV